MCAVLGFDGNFEKHFESIKTLMKNSIIRGQHAFGCAYWDWDLKEIVCAKYKSLDELISWMGEKKPNSFIYHNRYPTSGVISGSEEEDFFNENQPIVSQDKKSALVFNGVISQLPKEENERLFEVDLVYGNDGEIFLNSDQTQRQRLLHSSHKHSISGIIIEEHGLVYCFRNTKRPLWSHSREGRGGFVASTFDIFARTFPDVNRSNTTIIIPLGTHKFSVKGPLHGYNKAG